MKPSEIMNFIILAKKDEHDFVSGSRFLTGSSRKNNPLILNNFNKIIQCHN